MLLSNIEVGIMMILGKLRCPHSSASLADDGVLPRSLHTLFDLFL